MSSRKNAAPPPPGNGRVHLIVYCGQGDSATACIESFGAVDAVSVCGERPPTNLNGTTFIKGDYTTARDLAAKRGDTEYLIFADSDVELADPAMLNIITMHLGTNAAILGGMIQGPTGKVLAAGYVMSPTGQPYFRFKGWSPDHPKVAKPMRLQAVPFLFLATHRALYRKVQGFRHFGQFPYAEADFCIRAVLADLPVVYEPLVRLTGSGRHVPQQGSKAGAQLLASSVMIGYDEWLVL